ITVNIDGAAAISSKRTKRLKNAFGRLFGILADHTAKCTMRYRDRLFDLMNSANLRDMVFFFAPESLASPADNLLLIDSLFPTFTKVALTELSRTKLSSAAKITSLPGSSLKAKRLPQASASLSIH